MPLYCTLQLPCPSSTTKDPATFHFPSRTIVDHYLNEPFLYRIPLYCTVLYCTTPYCTVLHCTALYCTVLYLGRQESQAWTVCFPTSSADAPSPSFKTNRLGRIIIIARPSLPFPACPLESPFGVPRLAEPTPNPRRSAKDALSLAGRLLAGSRAYLTYYSSYSPPDLLPR